MSSRAANGFILFTGAVTLQVGTFTIVPPGSFRKGEDGSFTLEGAIDGESLVAPIKSTGTLRYAFHPEAKGPNLTGTTNPVPAMPTIGDDDQ